MYNGQTLRDQQWSNSWHTDLELALKKCLFEQPLPNSKS